MHPVRYKAMDAQRFDPMRRTRNDPSSGIGIPKLNMGQGLCIIHQPSAFPVQDTVGGVWPDHEVVVIPLSEAESDSGTSTLSSTSCSTSDASLNARASTPTTLTDFVVVPLPHAEVNVHDRDDLVITRTIIRPNRPPPVVSSTSSTPLLRSASSNRMNHFTRPSRVPRSAPCSRAASPSPSRPTSPVLQALNCFRSSSCFESDLASDYVEQDTRPALQVIVTQTREQFEEDIAFKQLVETVYPAAAAASRI